MNAADQHDMKQQALGAFLSDLPLLWAQRPGQWVAYKPSEITNMGMPVGEWY